MSTACLEQGINHGYAVEAAVLDAILRALGQLVIMAAEAGLLWVLIGTVLWANFGQRLDWDQLVVVHDRTGRLR